MISWGHGGWAKRSKTIAWLVGIFVPLSAGWFLNSAYKTEEEKARKKAEASGPALEDITPEDMLDHIEAIREIKEFSDVEKEIRTMCEQSSIPQCLVDIAISDPDKLDALEKEAEG